jgi:divalent metal cation (Fe/Co/Zn/Cd) transporter
MTPEQEAQYRSWVRWAIIVSWASVFIDLAFGFISLYIAIADKSVGIFGFSLENFLDVVTSLLIIWRFGGFSREALIVGDPVFDDKMEKREQRAEVLIALLFVLLGGLTCLIALIVLYEKESPDDVLSVIVVAAISIVVLALLAVAKFRLASALNSQSFRQDAFVTTISCILSIGLMAGSIIYHINNDIWYIDCLVALPLGGVLLLYGLKTLLTRKWWQAHFWGHYQTNTPIN